MSSFEDTVGLSELLVLSARHIVIVGEVALLARCPSKATVDSCKFTITGIDAISSELLVL